MIFLRKNGTIIAIMMRQKLTIVLLGLMWILSTRGFSTVTCYGADGHIAVEAIGHNHCQCPESGETGNDSVSIRASFDHDHCTDTMVPSNVFAPNSKSTFQKVTVLTFVLHSLSSCSSPDLRCSTLHSFGFSPFHTPLRTIVLLA